MMSALPPALPLLFAALLMPFLRTGARSTIALLASLTALALVFLAHDGLAPLAIPFLDGHLQLAQRNLPATAFGAIFAVAAALGVIYGWKRQSAVELAGAMLYAGSALGVAYSGDLLTLFVFWELMAVGSTLVVWSGGQPGSMAAGQRYAVVHLVGGVLLFAGIAMHAIGGGALAFGPDSLASPLAAELAALTSPAAWLMLLGILVNAGAPVLGAWLPDAYPEASPSGTVFLSAFTTKTAVLVLILLFPGASVLVPVGAAMAIYGLIYAAAVDDARRVLAYAIINQVGVMVVAVGIGSPLAIAAASAHAIAHILYKALLLMSAGAVLAQTGRRRLSTLGGLRHAMPFTAALAAVGVAAMALPPSLSFTTKAMVTASVAEAAGDLGHTAVYAWFALVAASAAIVALAGARYWWFTFAGTPATATATQTGDASLPMRAAMGAAAALILIFGIWTAPIIGMLPYRPLVAAEATYGPGVVAADGHLAAPAAPTAATAPASRVPFTAWSASSILYTVQLVAFALAAFALLRGIACPRPVQVHDADWLYRWLAPVVWRHLLEPVLRQAGRFHRLVTERLPAALANEAGAPVLDRQVENRIDLGGLRLSLRLAIRLDRARQWAIGGVMFVVTAVLLVYLILVFNHR